MLKIKKQIKDPSTGLITEIEGTEAEVEAFIKKHDKMQQESGTLQDRVKRKRDLILGKEAREEVEAMIAEAIVKHLYAAPHFQAIEHHWYHYRDYWWQPYWLGDKISYRYTTAIDPLNVGASTYTVCNSMSDLSDKIGCSSENISSQILGGLTTDNAKLDLDAYRTISGAKTNYAVTGSSWIDSSIKLSTTTDSVLGSLTSIASKA